MADNAIDAEPDKIGGFLVRIGVMRPCQHEEVLLSQCLGDTRLFGEIAIALGYNDDAALLLYIEAGNPSLALRPCTGSKRRSYKMF